jgi:HEPN domain-containing protein
MGRFSMDDDLYQEIQDWLFKSQRDLESAKVLFEHEFFDVVVYHCQQSAEKALKAYLVYQGVTLQKTHNLVVLLESCLDFDLGFEIFRTSAEVLTPYATEFRYPSDIVEPDTSEAEEALTMAESILSFVIKLLPDKF